MLGLVWRFLVGWSDVLKHFDWFERRGWLTKLRRLIEFDLRGCLKDPRVLNSPVTCALQIFNLNPTARDSQV